MRLRPARPDEAAFLSELAVRSKAHWGYDDDFLAGSRIQLTVHPDEVVARRVTVAELDGEVVGFYSLEGGPPVAELGLMFVEPGHIRSGIGRRLWTHATTTAAALGIESFEVDADPFAEEFYLAVGAIWVGETPSSIVPGRMLPRLTFAVTGT